MQWQIIFGTILVVTTGLSLSFFLRERARNISHNQICQAEHRRAVHIESCLKKLFFERIRSAKNFTALLNIKTEFSDVWDDLWKEAQRADIILRRVKPLMEREINLLKVSYQQHVGMKEIAAVNMRRNQLVDFISTQLLMFFQFQSLKEEAELLGQQESTI